MTRPTLILHIGQTKTASTTLQAFCHTNRRWLRERGVVYPEPPADHAVRTKHHHLVESLRPPGGRASAPWQALAPLAEEAGVHTLVISDEVFWHLHGVHPARRPAALAWMADQLAPFEVRVVCYLRRQDHWLESWFNQQAKGGQARSASLDFERFVERYQASGLLAYDRVLADWAEAFGEQQLVVRAFERAQLAQGDILDDFFALIGLPDLEGARRPGDRQLALSRPASLLMNHVNRQGASEALREQLRRAWRLADGDAPDPRRLLSPALAAELLARADAGNAEVARRYRGGQPLFTDLQVHPPALHYPALTREDCEALLARLPPGTLPRGWQPSGDALAAGGSGTADAGVRGEADDGSRPAHGQGHVQAHEQPPLQPHTQGPTPPADLRPGHAASNPQRCARAYIYTIPKAGTYLMSEFLDRLGLASSGWHISQNRVLQTHAVDAETNRAEPSKAMQRSSYVTSFRQLEAGQHAFGHFSPAFVPPGLLAEKDYRIVAVRRHPREVLVSEFIDFRHRRRDVDWISTARIADHHQAFVVYVREHGPVIRNICNNFLLLQAMTALPEYQELLGGQPRCLFVDFRVFVNAATGPGQAQRIAHFLGVEGSAPQVAALHAQALAADNKTRADGMVLPYERDSLWTPAAELAYHALAFDDLARRLGY